MSDIDYDSLDAKQQKELMAWAGKRKNQKQLKKIQIGEFFKTRMKTRIIQFLSKYLNDKNVHIYTLDSIVYMYHFNKVSVF